MSKTHSVPVHAPRSTRQFIGQLLGAALFAATSTVAASAQTPALQADWIQSPINGHWYGVDYTPRSWTDSEALAVSLGGHLATIRSQAEQDWIDVNALLYAGSQAIWIGCNDLQVEGTYEWTSAEAVTFTNWWTGEPNGGANENYAGMYPQDNTGALWPKDAKGHWNDFSSSFLFRPLIELPTKPQVGWSWPKVITNSADGARSVYAADLDGDGDADVLSASFYDDKIAWYENLGGGAFGPQQVISTAGANPSSVYTSDLDGDGDVDVLSTSHGDGKVAWYENLGSGVFGTQQVITNSAAGAFSVYATDLDGDGDADVLSSSEHDDKIAWYENLGGGIFGSQTVISIQPNTAWTFCVIDLDGDGDSDVLSASASDDKIAWHENDGSGAFGAQKVITTGADGAINAHATDLDGDGDSDVLSVSLHDDKIAWYENLGGGNFGPQQVITTTMDRPDIVRGADLDGDGDADVLSVSSQNDTIAWNENLGSGVFGTQQVITTAADSPHSVYATDLDGDGDADVLSASNDDDKIAWYENHTGPYDCNGNGTLDADDILLGTSQDCNANSVPDECEVASGASSDCNANGIPDSCELLSGAALDCNANGIPDECDLASGFSFDIDGDGQLDDCVAPPLLADTYEMSLAFGGTQSFSLSTPPLASAVSLYVLLGTISGTTPGVPVGSFTVPLNPDAYLNRTFNFPSTPPLGNSIGIMTSTPLGGSQASATFSLPPALTPTLVGLTLHHAFLTVDFQTGNVNFVSNAVPLALLP